MRTLYITCAIMVFPPAIWGQGFAEQRTFQPVPLTPVPNAEPRNLPESVVRQANQRPPITIVRKNTDPAKTLTRFDPQQAQARWVQGRWEVQAGTVWLKDCGRDRVLARDCCDLIRALGVNQRGTIGTPYPIMEYWLTNGKAPQTVSTRMRLWNIDLQSLRAVEVSEDWCVADKKKIYFNFGRNRQDALQAVAVIEKYGFDRVGYLGSPRPVMIYFLGGRNTHTTRRVGNNQPSGTVFGGKFRDPASGQKPDTVRGSTTPKEPSGPVVGDLYLKHLARSVKQLSAPVRSGGTNVRFDPKHLLLRQQNGAWKVFTRNNVLADFGPDVRAAQDFLQLARYYRINQQVWVENHPEKVCYFLSNGRAPRGLRFGLSGQRFQPHLVKLKRLGKHYYLAVEDQPLLYVSEHKESAEQLVAAIRRYRFDFLVRIGTTAESSLPLFVRSR
ncbi:MAG: hypothetical protein ACFCD0_20690 [Gemmataceae bacterium]